MRYYGSLKKKRVILLLLLSSMLISIPKISIVQAWTGVVYIRADGSVDPPTAPIQRNANYYTLTGNIASDAAGIVIERNNIVLDGAGYTVQGLGGSGSADHAGIILTSMNQVTIKNLKIMEFSIGIRVYQSASLTISGNNLISNLNWGIYLWSSHNNTISENNITENNNQGLDLTSSSNNTISRNNIANSRLGLILSSYSSNNRILGNIFTNDGLNAYASYGNIVEGNIVNGKPLVYLEDASDRTVDNAGQVILINCDNIRVENLNISNTSVGLELWGTNNSRIANNIVSNNVYGIYLGSSSNDNIIENKITANKENGIYLYSSTNNSIIGNNIANNIEGVELDESSSNNLIKNNITGSGGPGIYLSGVDGPTDYNRIFGNNLEDNNYGIWLGRSSGNNIYENNITLSHEYGIYLYQSSNNKFYHNNFVDNTNQVFVSDSASVWDDGYFSGGNYWNDYTIADEKSGPDQDQLGSDGIRDTPRSLGPYNSDHYPLVDIYNMASAYPVADFIYSPNEPIADEDVNFDASSSTCQNGTITTYYWSFGDGAFSAGSVVTHKYDSYGSYNITLTVISNSRLLSNQTRIITLREKPTANFHFSPTSNLATGQVITFDASTSTPCGGNITDYMWNFGDGNKTSTTEPVVVHVYALAKTFNVTLTVLDSERLNSSCFQLVKVWMPAFISISTSSSSAVVGFAVGINGTLYDVYGNGLENQTVVLYYTFSGANTWVPITSDTTDQLGKYYINWIPPATGYFTVKAVWTGNSTHFGASNSVSLSTIPYQNSYVFAVESNSTISALAFNSTSLELSFTVSGETGTRGYVKVTIAKSLISNIADVKVYLDGNQTEYSATSQNDAWILTFTYTHSTRYVTIDLKPAITTGISPDLTTWIYLITALIVVALVSGIVIIKRRKQKPKEARTKTLLQE